MATIKTVKPAGGGDYTTLAAWWTARKTSGSADEWAECDAGNVGSLTATGMTATPNASAYPKIYAASGQQHNCIDPTTGPYGEYIAAGTQYMRFVGLAMSTNNVSVQCYSDRISAFSTPNIVDGCLLIHTANSGVAVYAYDNVNDPGVIRPVVQNCIIRATTGVGVKTSSLGGGASGGIRLWNSTIKVTSGYGVQIEASDAWNWAQVKNNAIMTTAGTCIVQTGSGGDYANNIIQYNATTDTSPTGLLGTVSNNLTSQTATDLFTDPTNNDFTIKSGSALIDAGTDLSADFSTDILGNPRPSGAAWDIGAFEVQQAAAGGGGQRSSACISPFHFPGPGL